MLVEALERSDMLGESSETYTRPVIADKRSAGALALFIGDGVHDGAPTRELAMNRLGRYAEVIIPPPKTAVASAIVAGTIGTEPPYRRNTGQGPAGLAEIHRL
jgi:hypothetical protein